MLGLDGSVVGQSGLALVGCWFEVMRRRVDEVILHLLLNMSYGYRRQI